MRESCDFRWVAFLRRRYIYKPKQEHIYFYILILVKIRARKLSTALKNGKLTIMKILGIDPGFERLGVAILEKNKGDKKEKVLFSECFKTSAKLEFSERLSLIGKEVDRVIKKFKPEMLSIETLFLTTNQKTVM